jgi:hypothetical protein
MEASAQFHAPAALLPLTVWPTFDPDNSGSKFHRNVGKHLPDYLGSHSGRQHSSVEHENCIYFSTVTPFEKYITLTIPHTCIKLVQTLNITAIWLWRLVVNVTSRLFIASKLPPVPTGQLAGCDPLSVWTQW